MSDVTNSAPETEANTEAPAAEVTATDTASVETSTEVTASTEMAQTVDTEAPVTPVEDSLPATAAE